MVLAGNIRLLRAARTILVSALRKAGIGAQYGRYRDRVKQVSRPGKPGTGSARQ